MSTTNENKPVGKSGKRGKKGEQRRQKPDPLESPALVQTQSPDPDHQLHLQPDQAESAKPELPPAQIHNHHRRIW